MSSSTKHPKIEAETEQALRKRAIEWMETKYRDQPSGSFVEPPPFYQCKTGSTKSATASSASDAAPAPERPCVWIKDWVTGKVRPTKWTDEVVAGQVNCRWP
ncbi:hypothetical protein B0T20DRAFT_404019 [Sordaria brevicollis]|uniref:Uncharacterized protein n=1 Tax=Sordaria brevicollis TaxID=83679 RepID=A0AAE0PLM5_SORBR|nr:hypothetical protein B0T20DRAFT_404019 [Sordaria brevicollis]